jgi:nitrite reductase (NADH) small subunit
VSGTEPAAAGVRDGVAHELGPLDDIPMGEARAYNVAGRQIAVFRPRSGGPRALDAVCPHAGGPIADGQADASTVVCPLHGHTFDLATGVSASGAPPLACYPVVVTAEGTIVVTVG